MIKKKNRFVRPKKIYEKSRIEEENVLKEKYGLKNKKEIWKTLAKVNYFRRRAKDLANSTPEEQQIFFEKLHALGLKTSSTADVLALKVEDILERRLPTIVLNLKIATTINQARQMVVHKNILIDGRAVNVPSYIVKVSEESKITLDKKKKAKPVKEEKPVEAEKVEESPAEEPSSDKPAAEEKPQGETQDGN